MIRDDADKLLPILSQLDLTQTLRLYGCYSKWAKADRHDKSLRSAYDAVKKALLMKLEIDNTS